MQYQTILIHYSHLKFRIAIGIEIQPRILHLATSSHPHHTICPLLQCTCMLLQIFPDIQHSLWPKETSDHMTGGHKLSTFMRKKKSSEGLRNGE